MNRGVRLRTEPLPIAPARSSPPLVPPLRGAVSPERVAAVEA